MRADHIREEQEQIIAMRQKIRREMDEQKEKIVSDFYQKQKRNNTASQNFMRHSGELGGTVHDIASKTQRE